MTVTCKQKQAIIYITSLSKFVFAVIQSAMDSDKFSVIVIVHSLRSKYKDTVVTPDIIS